MADIFFLIGDVRSGSTLLSSLLDLYEDIGVTIESNFMLHLLMEKPFFSKTGDPRILFEILMDRDRFANLGIDFSDFNALYISKNQNDISAFTSCLLESYFAKAKPDAKVWVVKDNTNGSYIHQINNEIPSARFLHILRDGRAVLNSMMRTIKPYGKREIMARDPLSAARNWRNLVTGIDAFSCAHPGLVLETRYEELLGAPQKELDSIRQFLGLAPQTIPQASAKKYYDKLPDQEKKIHGLLGKELSKVRSCAWENELPKSSRMLFEFIAQDTLINKGYGNVGRIGMRGFLAHPRLMREYLLSVFKHYKSWIDYLLNPGLLRRIVAIKIMCRKEAKAFVAGRNQR